MSLAVLAALFVIVFVATLLSGSPSVGVACLVIGVVVAVGMELEAAPTHYERLDGKLPWCPESGIQATEHKIGRAGLNTTLEVMQDHGWSNLTVERRGSDGFWSSSYRVVMAQCNVVDS